MGVEIIGTLKCPHCGNEHATVHEQKGKANKLYYRCYARPGSADPRCGTVQITGPSGQEWIRANMVSASKDPEPAPADPQPTKDPAQQPEPPKKSGTLGGFINAFLRDDEE